MKSVGLVPQMQVFYSKRYPGVKITNSNDIIAGRSSVLLEWHGKSYLIDNLTSIDDGLLRAFDEPAALFEHTHTETASYDEYKTKNVRITVVYEGSRLKEMDVRIRATEEGTDKLAYAEFQCLTIDEAQELITALHAAVAGIHKKGSNHNE